MLFVNTLVPETEVGEVEKEEGGEEQMEGDGEEKYDAGLPVTQSDDPLSGGHLLLGASKAPLYQMKSDKYEKHEAEKRQRVAGGSGEFAERKQRMDGLTPGPPENVVE